MNVSKHSIRDGVALLVLLLAVNGIIADMKGCIVCTNQDPGCFSNTHACLDRYKRPCANRTDQCATVFVQPGSTPYQGTNQTYGDTPEANLTGLMLRRYCHPHKDNTQTWNPTFEFIPGSPVIRAGCDSDDYCNGYKPDDSVIGNFPDVQRAMVADLMFSDPVCASESASASVAVNAAAADSAASDAISGMHAASKAFAAAQSLTDQSKAEQASLDAAEAANRADGAAALAKDAADKAIANAAIAQKAADDALNAANSGPQDALTHNEASVAAASAQASANNASALANAATNTATVARTAANQARANADSAASAASALAAMYQVLMDFDQRPFGQVR